MTKKHWAWLLIGVGAAMVYSTSQLTAGKVDVSTTMGKLENDLASVAILGSPAATVGTTTTPYLAYVLMAVGAWMLFR